MVDKPAGMVVHPAPGNWTRHARERAQGARRRRCPSSAARSGRGSSTGSTRRRPGCCSSPRPTARTGCWARRCSGARSSGGTPRCAGGTSTATGSRWTSRSRAIRETESVWQSSVRDGRHERTSCGSPASIPWTCCARTCTPGARTRSACISRRSGIRWWATTPTVEAAGGKLVPLPPKRHFLHAAWLRFRHPATGEPVELRSPLPQDLVQALVARRGRRDVRSPTSIRWSTLASTETIPESRAAARTLLFRVAGKVYGCDIDAVREIIPYRRATRLPGAPSFVQGLINLRGHDRHGARSGRAPRPGASAGAGRVDHPRHARRRASSASRWTR